MIGFDLSGEWRSSLQDEFKKDYMKSLTQFLSQRLAEGEVIYPKSSQLFSAFDLTPLDDVKVVILGQDPYHGPNQAHGLSFSVPSGVRVPPSLLNIYKEIKRDFGGSISKSGDLTHWARQGVLLLNATLSVEASRAGSHQKKGWEEFTDRVIEVISDRRENVVFMLWGAYAQKKGRIINRDRHYVLQAPHPSPLSAHRGFIGCGHFSQANQYLKSQGIAPIQWEEKALVEPRV